MFRKLLDIEQNIFATLLHRSKRTISSWENDNTEASHKDLDQMVKIGANPEFLLTGKGSILREGFKRGS